MSHWQIIIGILILCFLLLLSAFFSCAETALMAVNRYRLRHQARMKNRQAIRVLQLLKRPDRILGVILIGNTFANTLASSLTTLLALRFWGEEAAFLAAVLLTFLILIFAEITPKTLAALYADQVARLVARPINWFLRLTYPLVWFANTIANSILKLFHFQVGTPRVEPLSREELRSIVYDTSGKSSREYQNMLLTILDLNKLTVDDVMVPRHEIVGIDIMQSWEQIVESMNKLHREWLPFYKENVNQLEGILYVPDLLSLIFPSQQFTKESLLGLLQEPYFVPEGTSLNTQLSYFQRTSKQIAFVVDEYGEIQGQITLNDILEEIVGDFSTSLALTAKRIQLQSDNSYLVDGAVTVREFNRVTGWELPWRGPKTINGLIIEHMEALPKIGVTILINGHPSEIVRVQENRVETARIFPNIYHRTE